MARAACTAASAPRSRTIRLPSHQAEAFSGKGWPLQALSCEIALAWSISMRNVSVAGATGSTFSETSRITPSTPIEPANRRETS